MNPLLVTVVILLVLLLVVALVAPRMRTRSLVPIVCILLGWYWAAGGFMPTLDAVGHSLQTFVRSLPLR